jgi:hypothetical protein
MNALVNKVRAVREALLNVTEHTNLEHWIRVFFAYRLARNVQQLQSWFHAKPPVQERPRYVAVFSRQEDPEDLRELQWRAAVQRNIERRRALRLLHGGRRGQRGAR